MRRFPLAHVLFLAICMFGPNPHAWAAPLRNWPTITLGEQETNVRALQSLLAAHGYKVSADGFFGKATQKALRQFQHTHQLIASGETNTPTWEALVVTVHQGSKGPAVRAVQFELRDAGYAVATNGIFDARMKTVVQQYQKQTGHTADGIIGLNTWCELLGGNESEGD